MRETDGKVDRSSERLDSRNWMNSNLTCEESCEEASREEAESESSDSSVGLESTRSAEVNLTCEEAGGREEAEGEISDTSV